MAQDKKGKKQKRPTALKRNLQSEKSRLHNKELRSRVNTALRSYEHSLTSTDEAAIKEKLSTVYSLMDKGLKTGLYKANKVNRVKSRLTLRSVSK